MNRHAHGRSSQSLHAQVSPDLLAVESGALQRARMIRATCFLVRSEARAGQRDLHAGAGKVLDVRVALRVLARSRGFRATASCPSGDCLIASAPLPDTSASTPSRGRVDQDLLVDGRHRSVPVCRLGVEYWQRRRSRSSPRPARIAGGIRDSIVECARRAGDGVRKSRDGPARWGRSCPYGSGTRELAIAPSVPGTRASTGGCSSG
jgi:hypothetical protein